jgi:hypothetical protein
MRLKNESGAFKVKFNNFEFDVPNGEFDVTPELGNFIVFKANNWGLKVEVTGYQEEPKIKKQEIKPEAIKKVETVVTPSDSTVIVDLNENSVDTNVTNTPEVKRRGRPAKIQ